MKPQSLEEFAQCLRVTGDFRESEFADEILYLSTLEEDLREIHEKELSEIEDKLAAIEKLLDYPADVMEEIEGLLDAAKTLDAVNRIVSDGSLDNEMLLDEIQALAERPEPMEYDL